MWFSKKKKNRRFGRVHVLDVKLRSQQARAIRTRLASRLAGGLVGTIAGLFLLWQGGNWLLKYFVFENNAFAISSIQVQTDGDIPVKQARQWAGVKLGENLLALDLSRVKRDLELVPWIREAAVERVLPRSLKVRISEREPLAQVYDWQGKTSSGGVERVVYYLDVAGYVMRPKGSWAVRTSPETTNDVLPVLVGIKSTELRPGRPAESEQVHAALRLVDAFERSDMFGVVDLTQIDLSTPALLRVSTAQSNEVTFATHQLDLQLRRWWIIHEAALKKGQAIATLDLSVSNHIPATWFEAAAITTLKPKTAKPIRPRKKNV
ncbi:MAG: FtsQ-type POTRA domain-containing protein [Verrucomicrobiota bacterium]